MRELGITYTAEERRAMNRPLRVAAVRAQAALADLYEVADDTAALHYVLDSWDNYVDILGLTEDEISGRVDGEDVL